MSFKENLLKKIQMDTLANKAISSFGPPDSGMRIDKDAMHSLMEMSIYTHQKMRDLDLYVADSEGEHKKILVLDNELPIYLTTVEDVVLRKSPNVKEMVSIRNMIKILKDSDVKISTKGESVKTVQKECIELLDLSYNKADIEEIARDGAASLESGCIELLDLSYNEADIEEIARDGAASLESGYAEGITESLVLFSELLGYQPPLKAFTIRHYEIFGAMAEKKAGEILYGPIVIFSRIDNSLKLIEASISSFDKEKLDYFRQVAAGNEKADIEGQDVFKYLKDEIKIQADSS
jgi:hypothetical protein